MSGGYYPSLCVNLRLRLDEAYHRDDPPKGESIDDRVKSPRGGTGTSGKRPAMMRTPSSKKSLSRVIGVVPLTASIEHAGYRQAGKWSMNLLFRDLPLDPRMIRAVGVEIFLGTVSAADFYSGMVETTPAGQRRRSIIPTTLLSGQMAEANLLMVGVGDVIDAEFGSKGIVLSVEGRDLRGLLLDAKVRPGQLAALNLSGSIVQVVIDILRQHPLMDDVVVIGLADDWPGGQVPSPGVVGDLTRVNVEDVGSARSTKPSSGKDQKPAIRPSGSGGEMCLWDIITKYCFLVGAIPFFQGEELWIRPAYSLYDYTTNPNHLPHVPVPFRGGKPRKFADGENPLKFRRMVYGRDIDTLKFSRKLQGTKRPAVEVVCTDTSSDQRGLARLLIERYPPEDEDNVPTSISPSGSASLKDVMRIPVHGIRNPNKLREIAKSIYEEIGRGEITGSVSTKDLASFAGDNDDADLLRLRPGDPVEILADASPGGSLNPIVSELNEQQQRSPEEQVEFLAERLGDRSLAQVLVDTARGQVADLQRIFRVNTVRYSWDSSSGVAVDFDFHNYVEATAKEEKRIQSKAASKPKAAPIAGATKPSAYEDLRAWINDERKKRAASAVAIAGLPELSK